MGFFRRKKNNKQKGVVSTTTTTANNNNKSSLQEVDTVPEQTPIRKPVSSTSCPPKRSVLPQQPKSLPPQEEPPTMEMLPDLIRVLQISKETSSDTPARALRLLFALSEHGHTENRTEMVRVHGGRLVPSLLGFLERCQRSSSEQYLTLLVLNNISIPTENKRIIALDYGGAKVCASILCDDPSCHLMAIILVNLTFADADLRKEIVSANSGAQLVESLAFALRVATLTPEQFEHLQPVIEGDLEIGMSAKERLVNLMVDHQKLLADVTSGEDASGYSTATRRSRLLCVVDPSKQLFPETARWCLSVLKNLTRPCKDVTAPMDLIESGIVPLILQFITIGADHGSSSKLEQATQNVGSNSSSSGTCTPSLDPGHGKYPNAPYTWDSNSMQDAALFIVMNLAACSSSRAYVNEIDAVSTLSCITEYNTKKPEQQELTIEVARQQEFQSMKARMALAYLLGSEGHFGQVKLSSFTATIDANSADSVLILPEAEVHLLVELLSNTMHGRGKDGSGRYSAATFSVKYVVFAIRCLLTHEANQILVSQQEVGVKLNALLMKLLAQHSIQKVPSMDAEAAEYACFSLYLQSNHGFKEAFLPALFTSPDTQGSLTDKVLSSYLGMSNVTPTGRHAAEQILLRCKHLVFKGRMADLAAPGSNPSVSDMAFDDDLLSKAEKILVAERPHGAKPRDDIFDRVILRSRAPRKGNKSAPWDNLASVSAFSSAIHAVQQLSYGSTKVRHIDAIDDILIANNISNSANGEKTEAYDYWWSWQDKADLERNNSASETSRVSLFGGVSHRLAESMSNEHSTPMTIFGLRCGPMCSADTTMV